MTKKQTKKVPNLTQRVHRHVKLAAWPHRDNQYRPHAVGRYGIAAFLGLVLGIFLIHNTVMTGDVLGRKATITPEGLLVSANQAREKEGFADLKLNEQLNEAAYAKAQDMLKNQYWAHESPAGVQPWKWFADAGYNYSQAGENLARNFTTSNAVTAAWLASSSHRENVLGATYQDVGFAAVEGEVSGQVTTIVVALYGVPARVGTVAGETQFNKPEIQTGLVAEIGRNIQALPATAVGSLALVTLAAGIALAAHAYRRKLPKALQQSWYHHHGIFKTVGFLSIGVIIVVIYSGGQI